MDWRAILKDPIAKLLAQEEPSPGFAVRAAATLGISRQAVSKRLKAMEAAGYVEFIGSTRARIVRPVLRGLTRRRIGVTPSLDEYEVWSTVVEPHVSNLGDPAVSIWRYGVTEMVNNVVDHSQARNLTLQVLRSFALTCVTIEDDGVGAFSKVAEEMKLSDERHAAFELTKGKFTTDAKRHSGEGIFFTSRAFGTFMLESGRTGLAHVHASRIWWLEALPKERRGTQVVLALPNDVNWTMNDVYEEFTADAADDFKFEKTVVPLKLAEFEGGALVSRSQAKRVSARFERFHIVVLDFEGVPSIGQGFADELFRVFAAAYPHVQLVPIHASPEVTRMIDRVTAK